MSVNTTKPLTAPLFVSVDNPQFWLQVLQFLSSRAAPFLIIEIYVAILGLIVTVFHITVLTRKSIMVSLVISIMIGIAVCDFISMLVVLGWQHVVLNFTRDECTPPTPYPTLYAFYIFLAIRDDVMRCSTWLSILMTAIRSISIRSNSNISLQNVSFGFYSFGIVLAISSVFSMLRHLRLILVAAGPWFPGAGCSVEACAEKVILYQQITSDFFSQFSLQVFNLVNGVVTRILPCTLLPILSLLLVWQIRTARKQIHITSALVQKRTEKTTTMVILMGATFFIANLPSAIVMFFQALHTDIGFIRLSVFVDRFCNAILTVNATVHCVICVVISTDYRKAAKKLLGFQEKKRVADSLF